MERPTLMDLAEYRAQMDTNVRSLADLVGLGPLRDVSEAVGMEIDRQNRRWGVQDHPLIGGNMPSVTRGTYVSQAANFKRRNNCRVAAGNLGWDTILLEEVYEALESQTPEGAIEELIQVAAVAMQAVLAIKRAQS